MGKVGILSRCEELKLLEDQGWDPVGIISVDFPGELDEFLELPSVPQFNRVYRDGGWACHACTFTGCRPHLITFPGVVQTDYSIRVHDTSGLRGNVNPRV